MGNEQLLSAIEHNAAMLFTDEQAMILQSARDFCREKSPVEVVRSLLACEQGYRDEVWQEQANLGWTGLCVSEEFDGLGLGLGAAVPLVEAMGQQLLSTPLISSQLAAYAISRGGNLSQQEEWLPKIVAGSVATVALLDSEDWGFTSSCCELIEEGGSLRLRGEKYFVSDASVAEVFIVYCQYRGQDQFVLVPASEALQISPQVLIDETKRAARVDFSGVALSGDSLLSAAGAAELLREVRLAGALLTAAEAAGSTAACLDTTVAYLNERVQFGRPIGSYQGLKHPTVEILCSLDAARSHIYNAATLVDSEDFSRDAEVACRMAKVQATAAASFAADRSVQFHGGMGFTYECNAQLYLRRSVWSQQQFGDELHHRKRLATLLFDGE